MVDDREARPGAFAGNDFPQAWARFRDLFEAERARIEGLIETARTALESPDCPHAAVRESLAAAEDALKAIDRALAELHALMLAAVTVQPAASTWLN